ncbi:MAG: hypothetical protein ACM65L_08080 [Microcoleus sp.]
MPKNPTWLRYEPDENISRHAAADDECCYEMETKYGWTLKRIEKLQGDILTEGGLSEFGMVVICYCRYNPIDAPLKSMPDRQVSIDSFGDDTEDYERWLESQKDRQPAEV